MKLTFYGHICYTIKIKLTKLFRESYPNNIFKFILPNSLNIKSFLRYKDPIPFHPFSSNVVYGYTCSNCKARNIAKLKETLFYPSLNTRVFPQVQTNQCPTLYSLI